MSDLYELLYGPACFMLLPAGVPDVLRCPPREQKEGVPILSGTAIQPCVIAPLAASIHMLRFEPMCQFIYLKTYHRGALGPWVPLQWGGQACSQQL